jgi:hypothetical protein
MEAVEQAYRKRELADTARASALGLNKFEYRAWKKTATAEWVEKIRALMEQSAARDPIEVLPEIIVQLLEEIGKIAETKAETSARSTVQRMLKKVMAE